jgi:hypothetical protein
MIDNYRLPSHASRSVLITCYRELIRAITSKATRFSSPAVLSVLSLFPERKCNSEQHKNRHRRRGVFPQCDRARIRGSSWKEKMPKILNAARLAFSIEGMRVPPFNPSRYYSGRSGKDGNALSQFT